MLLEIMLFDSHHPDTRRSRVEELIYMYVGKYLIFIVGLSAGIAAMVGFSYFSNKEAVVEPDAVTVTDSSTSAVVPTPFSIVDEPSEPMPTVAAEFDPLDIEELMERIADAENRIEVLELELGELRVQQLPIDEPPTDDEQVELLSSVFEPAIVSEIQAIRDDNQLQRLELRDRAIREGWINTDRFREESRALSNVGQLRESLGDEGYDQLLVAEGRDNRVRIESVIENSAADLSGIEVGDVIIRYADERIFQFRDLRDATTEGERNESVTIQVSRNGELIDLVIPRGPMGVTLTGVTEPPLQ